MKRLFLLLLLFIYYYYLLLFLLNSIEFNEYIVVYQRLSIHNATVQLPASSPAFREMLPLACSFLAQTHLVFIPHLPTNNPLPSISLRRTQSIWMICALASAEENQAFIERLPLSILECVSAILTIIIGLAF